MTDDELYETIFFDGVREAVSRMTPDQLQDLVVGPYLDIREAQKV